MYDLLHEYWLYTLFWMYMMYTEHTAPWLYIRLIIVPRVYNLWEFMKCNFWSQHFVLPPSSQSLRIFWSFASNMFFFSSIKHKPYTEGARRVEYTIDEFIKNQIIKKMLFSIEYLNLQKQIIVITAAHSWLLYRPLTRIINNYLIFWVRFGSHIVFLQQQQKKPHIIRVRKLNDFIYIIQE